MSHRRKPANAALVISILALAAALVGTAAAGPGGPNAQTPASAKRISLAALKQARKAKKAARVARRVARAARKKAAEVQSEASSAKAAAAQAQDSAAQLGRAIDQATLGRSGFNIECDPTSISSYVECVSTTLTLPRTGRVLLVAAGGQVSSLEAKAAGRCRLEVDGSTTAIPHATVAHAGEQVMYNTSTSGANGFATSAVTDNLPTGTHKFEMSCNEIFGDQVIRDAKITAVMIGAG